jgi:hypothetical protein
MVPGSEALTSSKHTQCESQPLLDLIHTASHNNRDFLFRYDSVDKGFRQHLLLDTGSRSGGCFFVEESKRS